MPQTGQFHPGRSLTVFSSCVLKFTFLISDGIDLKRNERAKGKSYSRQNQSSHFTTEERISGDDDQHDLDRHHHQPTLVFFVEIFSF